MIESNEVFIEDELINSYLSYAMSVIVGRALPDVRDGLKPVHRRILFVMHELNNTFEKSYKKSARVVGDVIGKYHPHGEIAVYDSIVRLSQPFVQRYVLIDGQGNFGSIDGDTPAAMRYTEIRMSEFSNFLLSDLDYSVVDFIDNYDGTEKQPVVLPAMIPNLLINGTCGIAVGVATNIPPHNLIDIIDACLLFLDDSNINISDLFKIVLAPDFPTGGIIYGDDDLFNIYKLGKGKFLLRANTYFDIDKLGDYFIVVDELPYQVNKSKLIESIGLLIDSGLLVGIKAVRDESDKNGLRIAIELHKNSNPDVILNKLFLYTKMQITYNVNMIALVDNTPKLLDLKSIIKCFIDHRKEVIYRKTRYLLVKAERRVFLLEGLCVAVYNLDTIVKVISMSNDFSDVKTNFNKICWNTDFFSKFADLDDLKKFNGSYSFSDSQIQSILDMKFSKMVKLEKNNLLIEYCNILRDILHYNKVLNDNLFLESIIKHELLSIKEKFGDKRKTKIIKNTKELAAIDLVLKENVIITISYHGYIKSQLLKNYTVQHRGGKGKNAVFIKPDDYVLGVTVCDTHSVLLCFSTLGKVYWIDLYNFPLSSRQSQGIPIINLLNLSCHEKINFILPIKSYDVNKYIFLVTKKGFVKRIMLSELKNQRSNGVIVINLIKNDSIVDVKIVDIFDSVMLLSKFGKAIKFFVKDVRCTKRLAQGVFGIKLDAFDNVVSLVILDLNGFVFTVTENGYGKRTKFSDYPLTKRGLKGVICMRFDNKHCYLSGAEKVFISNDLLLITNSGIISRIRVSDIPCTGRNTKGVLLINLADNEKLIGIKEVNKEFL